ncbi:MAG TPA: transposase [Acidobacteriota bacterium]|jgi:REP element-mobilizing transposase RayT|nr:transposase [Acidobacteriota bacterium]
MKTDQGIKEIASKLHCYRVRLRRLPQSADGDFVFEKVIACFKLHERNLYQAPDFVLCDVAPFGRNLDLLVKTQSRKLLLKRLKKLKIPHRSMRCRPFNPANWKSRHGFAAWLVHQYGLDSSDPGRRKIRIHQRRPIGNNYTYHVWNRTPQRQLLFGEAEKEMMLQVLTEMCAHMPVQLHAFVFMGNHFHLVVTTIKDVSISQLMQEFEWQVSTRYNRLHQTSGTLWQGPFKHTVWEPTAANLVRLIDYLHANPLRAGLVADVQDYRWSSYSHYAGLQRRKMLVVPLPLRRRWTERKIREAWYRDHFAEQYRSGKLQYDPDLAMPGMVGSKKFAVALEQQLGGPYRLPAFVKNVLRLQRQRRVWGLKTFLHLLCKPIVDRWLQAQHAWMELAERVGPLVPARESPD